MNGCRLLPRKDHFSCRRWILLTTRVQYSVSHLIADGYHSIDCNVHAGRHLLHYAGTWDIPYRQIQLSSALDVRCTVYRATKYIVLQWTAGCPFKSWIDGIWLTMRISWDQNSDRYHQSWTLCPGNEIVKRDTALPGWIEWLAFIAKLLGRGRRGGGGEEGILDWLAVYSHGQPMPEWFSPIQSNTRISVYYGGDCHYCGKQW